MHLKLNLQPTWRSWPLFIGTSFMARWQRWNTMTDDLWWKNKDCIMCMPRPVSGIPLIMTQRNRMLVTSNCFSIFSMRVTPSLNSNLCCFRRAEARSIGVSKATTCTVYNKEEVSGWVKVMAFLSMCPIHGCWMENQRGLTLVLLKWVPDFCLFLLLNWFMHILQPYEQFQHDQEPLSTYILDHWLLTFFNIDLYCTSLRAHQISNCSFFFIYKHFGMLTLTAIVC